MNPDWKARYDAAVTAAEQAGQLALRYFDAELKVEWKEDDSPVTVADREAESLLRTTLLGRFPKDGFLGEEHGDKPGTSGFRWIIDPIDGTRNFVRGIPIWGTLVGLEHKGETIAGIVQLPAMKQSFRALRGDGAWRGERRLQVSKLGTLSQATLFYTTLACFSPPAHQAAFLDLSKRVQGLRGFGDVYGYMLVAQGSGEAMVEHGVHIWDVAAVKPIIEEAGGRYSDWDGKPNINRPDSVASNGLLHEEILRVMRGSDKPPVK